MFGFLVGLLLRPKLWPRTFNKFFLLLLGKTIKLRLKLLNLKLVLII